MSFANPAALVLLLALPIPLLLRFVRRARREVAVATLRFWEAAGRPSARRLLLRRPDLDLPLLLRLVALLVLVLALARPVLLVARRVPPRLILLLDTSASMKAADEEGGRILAAKAQALALVDGLSNGQQAMLLEDSPRPRVAVPFTDDRRRLRRALEAAQAGDGPGRPDQAVAMALDIASTGPPAEIHVFTDGAFPRLHLPDRGRTAIVWHGVGRRAENVAIVAFDVRKALYGPFDYEAFLAVANFSGETKRFPLRLALDGAILEAREVELPAHIKRTFAIPFTHRRGGALEAAIGLADDLEADNRAYAILPEPRAVRVLLVTRGNLFLEQSLRVDPHAALTVRAPEASPPASWDADVIVLDRVAPRALAPGRYLLVHTLPEEGAPLQRVGTVQWPLVADWDREHPVTRYLDLSGLRVERALRVRPVGNGRSLVESAASPLVYAWDQGGVRAVFVGFDLHRSDLPLRAAFPLLVSNALRWLHPSPMEDARSLLKPGDAISLDADASQGPVMLTDPLGRTHQLFSREGAPRVHYGDTHRVGTYAVRTATGSRLYAVSLLDEEESNLAPDRGRPAGGLEAPRSDRGYPVQRELWLPLAAAALALLAAETLLYTRRTGAAGSRVSLAMRGVALAAIGVGLLQLAVRTPSDAVQALFLLDASDSIPLEAQRRGLEAVRRALKARRPSDAAGLATFGRHPRLEAPVERAGTLPAALPPPLDGGVTDLESAIRFGMALLPEEGSRRLLLLTDGNENRGSALEAAREAAAAGIELYVAPLGGVGEGEVALEQMRLPSEVRQGEPFLIRIGAWSGHRGKGRLSLYRDGRFVGSRGVDLVRGRNIVAVRDSLETEGFHLYQARLEAPGDAIDENNRAIGVVAVRGRPKVLYLERDEGQGRHLADALRAQGMQVEQVGPEGIPAALASLSRHDALILGNISALRLSRSQMEAIRAFVRDQGGGVLMLGGDESFGLGGYYRTPVEEALPVTMELRRRADVPSLAVILLIDRSGSMETPAGQHTRLDLAKEAAQLVVELLDERSELGVIGFDSTWSWVVPIGPAKAKEAIMTEIAAIKAGGGTEMFPALKEAYQALLERKAALKHVIVLSDGESSDADFAGLARRMARDKITLSSVAISSEAGTSLMREVSRWGRGRYYFTEDAYSIPRIFTMETQLASRASLVEQPFRPVVRAGLHEILKEIDWAAMPRLDGYVVTTAKPAAEVLLASPQDDPVLAVWRYGLGRAAAFASDAKTRWGTRWVTWDQFGTFFAQLVRWTMGSAGARELAARVDVAAGVGEIVVEAIGDRGEFLNFLDIEAGVIFPDRHREVFSLRQSGPGRYRASFPADRQGAYLIGISQRRDGQAIGAEVGGLAIPHSPEHRALPVNARLLADLARTTGGAVLADPGDAFRHHRRLGSTRRPVWPWALSVALALMVVVDAGAGAVPRPRTGRAVLPRRGAVIGRPRVPKAGARWGSP
jgi:uncharacterized membrane protein/secreted protein with Ig-like and vWFA domain